MTGYQWFGLVFGYAAAGFLLAAYLAGERDFEDDEASVAGAIWPVTCAWWLVVDVVLLVVVRGAVSGCWRLACRALADLRGR